MEMVSQFFPARRISRWIARRSDCADVGASGPHEIPKTRAPGKCRCETGTRMRVLFVDLEREWRGGQSQALLNIQGLRDNRHEVKLLAARDSPLAQRSARKGVPVHQVPRVCLRACAPTPTRRLIAEVPSHPLHLNY